MSRYRARPKRSKTGWVVGIIVAAALVAMAAILVHLRGRPDEPFESPVATSPEPSLLPEPAAATKPASRPAPVAPPETKPAATSPAVEPPPATEPAAPVHEPIFGLPAHESEHFLIYSNASDELKADVAMRLEALHAEYRCEMADVFEPSDAKAKALFIGDPDLFVQAGGEPYAPGVFRVLVDQNGNPVDGVGPRLVLRNSGDSIYLEITSLMQHEGWHQFCWHHVRKWAPIWWDEGTAHHYQYSVWTGDYMIHGGIHGSVLQVLLESAPSFMPLRDLLTLDDRNWRAWQGQVGFWSPYMESWSLIHFLKYAKGGAYEPLLNAYIADVAAGRDTAGSAEAIAALEGRWIQWLRSLQVTTTHVKFFEAIAAMLTGHLARAQLNGQTFESIDEFLTAAKAGKLQLGPIGSDTWLPRSIMGECVRYIDMYGKGYADRGDGPFEMVLEYVDGVPAARVKLAKVTLDIRATATVVDGRVASVKIEHLSQAHPDMQ